MRSHCVRASGDFLYGHLSTGRANPYGGFAEIVRILCDAGAVAVQSSQIQNENRTALVQTYVFEDKMSKC